MILLLLPVLSIVLTIVMVVAAFRTRKKMIRAIDEMLGSITDRFINAINDPMSDPPTQQAASNQGRRMAGAAAGGALGGILMADRAMQMVNRYSSDSKADVDGDKVDVDASQTSSQQTDAEHGDVKQGDVETKAGDTKAGDTAVTNDQAAQDEAERLKASGGITGANKPQGTDKTGAAESISSDVTTSSEEGVADAGSDSVVEKRAEEDAGKIQREHAAKAVVHTGEAVAGAYAGDANTAARGATQAIGEAKQAGDSEGAKAQAKREIRSGEEVEHGVAKGTTEATKDVAADTASGSVPGAPVPAGAEGAAGVGGAMPDGATGKKVIHGMTKQDSDTPSKPEQSDAPKPVPAANGMDISVPEPGPGQTPRPAVDATNPSAVKPPSAPKSVPGANGASAPNTSAARPHAPSAPNPVPSADGAGVSRADASKRTPPSAPKATLETGGADTAAPKSPAVPRAEPAANSRGTPAAGQRPVRPPDKPNENL